MLRLTPLKGASFIVQSIAPLLRSGGTTFFISRCTTFPPYFPRYFSPYRSIIVFFA